MEKKIAIIGAGISGLAACKHVMERGYNPVVFEAGSGIGGVWSHTIESTKLQTPKYFYQFSDFPWPNSVKETFPDHKQVMEYLHAYAARFNIFPRIRFNTKVISIEYVGAVEEDMASWELWSGTGGPFSPKGRWDVTVQHAQHASAPVEVYQMDFVILCIGLHSDLPNIPKFPFNEGPEVFDGEVLHSMDYASMDPESSAKFIRHKRVTVVGFQKSAIDLAVEVANRNGLAHPCTLLFKTVHWTVPESFITFNFKSLNRFTEFMIHKPGEGLFKWLLAFLLSPLLWLFSKVTELHLMWSYPLKKYKMIPGHDFLKQISSCMFTVLPDTFYSKVKEGSLILRKSQDFRFCKDGLIIDGDEPHVPTDVVIFATGYRGDLKLKNLFRSKFLQECAIGSAPLYRECIHPKIPQLSILGFSSSPSVLYTTEMRSKWLAHFIAGKFNLPRVRDMEADVKKWEKMMRSYAKDRYQRSCASVLLQIHCNDLLCKDMGYNSRRKRWFLAELFDPYSPDDYKYLCEDKFAKF